MTKPAPQHPVMEFHIARAARDRHGCDQVLFTLSGNAILPNFHAARMLAQSLNRGRDLVRFPERVVHAGDLNAMGLIDEILHFVAALYREQRNPHAMAQALSWLNQRLGQAAVDDALRRFAEEFPNVAVYRGEIGVDAYLQGETGGVPHRLLVLEEMLMLWLANANAACAPFLELFDDRDLRERTGYPRILDGLGEFFAAQPLFGPDHQSLVDMLRSPAIAVPHSLSGQLRFIRERWGFLLGGYLDRLLASLDMIQEEETARRLALAGAMGGGGRPSIPVYEFGALAGEPERYSIDLDWMPRLVLIAKSAYVWLDQLAREHGRAIARLDQVPDEELDRLARFGFTGLWLIGVWERSAASQQIKQMMGNPEAVASAYSLYEYRVADDLGGEAAFHSLAERAWARGIRLASDMVPNHMGIDSRWVLEHPDWFVGLDYSPFPVYSYGGPNLSRDPRVGLYLEDHYYSRSDAAVVFKRVDHATGRERYIYHGNDGTSMPWNDTAQLDYLKPEVREAVIQTILHVAHQFPIVRFDAAMTLTKRHYQRLWFPEPGSGGAIPSRAEHGLARAAFDQRMPVEFWREVVDRVAAEAPDTLLLAEAFWLMEGYFVRSLGMHRVYNSAFMNMLRDEDNAKYRSVIKNTLEFDPEILKRYVNFMNNPDERTAVDQFGKGDKYFGICTMMATLPGLPMFGHGQIEGYGEKYGMEFRRAYGNERPDAELVARHEREIVPLLHRRRLFAEVRDFLLYDFFVPEGHVNENVFAYSNRAGGGRALVVYHNRYEHARGWIRTSVAYVARSEHGHRRFVRRSLGEGLGLARDPAAFCTFRDQRNGLEYLRSSRELHEKGLFVELGAYQCHVFLDFREVKDDAAGHYAELARRLEGRGVPSLEEALQGVRMRAIHEAFGALMNAATIRRLVAARVPLPTAPEAAAPRPAGRARASATAEPKALLDDLEHRVLHLLRTTQGFEGGSGDPVALAREARGELATLLRLPASEAPAPERAGEPRVGAARDAGPDEAARTLGVLFAVLLLQAIGRLRGHEGSGPRGRARIDERQLGGLLAGAFRDLRFDESEAGRTVVALKALLSHRGWFEPGLPGDRLLRRAMAQWFADEDAQRFLQVHRHEGTLWFNREAGERLIGWMLDLATHGCAAAPDQTPARLAADLAALRRLGTSMRRRAEESGYRLETLLAGLKQEASARLPRG